MNLNDINIIYYLELFMDLFANLKSNFSLVSVRLSFIIIQIKIKNCYLKLKIVINLRNTLLNN